MRIEEMKRRGRQIYRGETYRERGETDTHIERSNGQIEKEERKIVIL